MSLAALIARHSNALTKACLGGGFFFGFAYTANNGTSPLRDFANAAGLESPSGQQQTTLTFRAGTHA